VYGAHDIFDSNLGFYKIAVRTKLFAALALVFGAKGGHHNNFDVFGLSSRAQDVEHIKTRNLRHHHIRHNKRRPILNGHCERFFTVTGTNDVVPLSQKSYAVYLTKAFVVLY